MPAVFAKLCLADKEVVCKLYLLEALLSFK